MFECTKLSAHCEADTHPVVDDRVSHRLRNNYNVVIVHHCIQETFSVQSLLPSLSPSPILNPGSGGDSLLDQRPHQSPELHVDSLARHLLYPLGVPQHYPQLPTSPLVI